MLPRYYSATSIAVFYAEASQIVYTLYDNVLTLMIVLTDIVIRAHFIRSL